METFRTAYVYVRRVYAGILCETDSGYSFQYDEDYLKTENATAVSLTLPVRTETYYAKVLRLICKLVTFPLVYRIMYSEYVVVRLI